MHDVARSPAFQFFESSTEVFQGLFVDEFEITFPGPDSYQAGDTIDDQPNTLIALPSGLLCLLQVFNIGGSADKHY